MIDITSKLSHGEETNQFLILKQEIDKTKSDSLIFMNGEFMNVGQFYIGMNIVKFIFDGIDVYVNWGSFKCGTSVYKYEDFT